jgi:hypothetical protein
MDYDSIGAIGLEWVGIGFQEADKILKNKHNS